MAEQSNTWQSQLNRLGRLIFGLHRTILLTFEESEVQLKQPVVTPISPELDLVEAPLNIELVEQPLQFGFVNIDLLPPPLKRVDPATLYLARSGELYIPEQLLLDIPGRLQLAGSLLFKKPMVGEITQGLFEPPSLKNFTAIISDTWSSPDTEDMVQLLTGQGKLSLPVPEIQTTEAKLWVQSPNVEIPAFDWPASEVEDLTTLTAGVWAEPDTIDMFALLSGNETDTPTRPDVREFTPVLEVNFEVSLDRPLPIPPPTPVDLGEILTWSILLGDDLFSLTSGESAARLSRPEHTAIFQALESPEEERIDFRLIGPDILDVTDQFVLDDISVPILDLFEFLVAGNVLGKDYDRVTKVLVVDDPEEDKNGLNLEICKHGIYKSTCDICNPREKKSKSGTPGSRRSKPKVVNLFDILLPYLQPPLDNNFDNNVIFPAGKSLFKFQIAGSYFLATNKSALLADEMGLGKSVQAITAMRILFRKSRELISVLIVSPKSVLKDWEKKLEEWAPELRVLLIEGSPSVRAGLWNTANHVYLVSYDTLAIDLKKLPSKRFTIIVLDEVQAIKSPSTKRTKAVRKIEAGWRWGLSATPLENKVEDLVSIFAYLNPSLLKYADTANRTRLKNLIKPYFLRRRIDDVRDEIDLKEIMVSERWLELTPEQRATYDEVLKKAQTNLSGVAQQHMSGSRNAGSEFETKRKVLAQITELKKICNFDPETGKSCKADYLKERLPDICADGEKVLIFSQYPNISLQPLANTLKKYKPDLFDGSLSNSARDKKITEFQESNRTNVMLMSVKAGGVGITLTRANHVFFLDQWWNPAIGKQAVGRAYRIGQQKNVFVTNFCTVGTIEERIREVLQHKEQLFDEIIDDQSDQVYKGITTEELFGLLDLVKYDVILKSAGKNIGTTIKMVAQLAELPYDKARQLVQRTPAVILQNLSQKEATQARIRIVSESGCDVEIRSSFNER